MPLIRSIVTRGFGENLTGGSSPTLPVISVANNNNGTATVTVSGSLSGATNTVRVRKVSTQWPTNAWVVTAASRVGNGTVNVTLDPGVYWFSVTSVASGSESSSAPVYQWVSDGTPPVLSQILDYCVAELQGMLLTDIDSADIVSRTAIDGQGLNTVDRPKIVVFPVDSETIEPNSPTTSDYIGYPVVVCVAAPANKNHSSALRDKWLLWRERIRRRLATEGIDLADATIVSVRYVPLTPYSRKWWEAGGFVSPLQFIFVSSELRT